MSVPKWRRSESRLDAFYEAVKLRHIVTQIIMRSYKLKTNFKSLIPDRLRNEYPELAKLLRRLIGIKRLLRKLKYLVNMMSGLSVRQEAICLSIHLTW